MTISLTSQQNTVFYGALDVSGITILRSNTNISGGLFATGASKFYNTLDVSSNTNISGGLFATGASKFYNTLDVTGATTCNNGLTVNNIRIYANAGYALTTGYGSSFKYGVFRPVQYSTWTRILTLTPANINYRYGSNDFISCTTYIISCRGMGSNRGNMSFDNYYNANNIYRNTSLDPTITYNYLGYTAGNNYDANVSRGSPYYNTLIQHRVIDLNTQSIGIEMWWNFEGGQIPSIGCDLMFEITSGENWIVS